MLFCKVLVLTSSYFSVPVAFLWVSDQPDPWHQQVFLLHTAAAHGRQILFFGAILWKVLWLRRAGASHRLAVRCNISRAASRIRHTVSERAASPPTLIYLSLSCCDRCPAAKPGWRSSGRWPPVSPNLLERQEHLRITTTTQQQRDSEDWALIWEARVVAGLNQWWTTARLTLLVFFKNRRETSSSCPTHVKKGFKALSAYKTKQTSSSVCVLKQEVSQLTSEYLIHQ